MGRFGPQPAVDPDKAVEHRVNKGARNGTCRLEAMNLVEVPRCLMELSVSRQMQVSVKRLLVCNAALDFAPVCSQLPVPA